MGENISLDLLRVFLIFSHSVKFRSANERLLRSPKDSLSSTDSNNNEDVMKVDEGATAPPKRDTTPIPFILE